MEQDQPTIVAYSTLYKFQTNIHAYAHTHAYANLHQVRSSCCIRKYVRGASEVVIDIADETIQKTKVIEVNKEANNNKNAAYKMCNTKNTYSLMYFNMFV